MSTLTIYLHIHKAGGSSLNNFLWSNFQPERTYRIDGTKPLVSYQKLISQTADPDFRKNTDLITGHHLYGLHSYFPGRKSRYITVMREPCARTISLFNYLFHSKAHPLAGTFEKKDFVKFLQDSRVMALDNGMTRMLSGVRFGEQHFNGIPFGTMRPWMLDAAKEHLEEHIIAGFTEALPESVSYFEKILGLNSKRKIGHVNKSQDIISPSELPAQAQELLAERNRYDLELYEFARSLYWDKITGTQN